MAGTAFEYGVAASVRVYRVRGTERFPVYGVTARLIVAVLLSKPDVPVMVSVVVDDGTYAAAVNVSFPGCQGVICKLDTETPRGSPVTPIVIAEMNPLEPVAVTETVADPFAAIVRLELETERLKVGVGPGGACCTAPPVPQPITTHRATAKNGRVAKFYPRGKTQKNLTVSAIRFPLDTVHTPF